MEGNGDKPCHGGRNNCSENVKEALSPVRAAGVRDRRSIAERRAVKCGFNASSIGAAARFMASSSPATSPLRVVRSPYLTLSPGISPTALHDSPVMLPNSLGQQSPPTGTFEFPEVLNHESFASSSITHHIGDGINTRMPDSISFPSTTTSKSQKSPGSSPPLALGECVDSSSPCDKQSDDGYKWRKYGQKQVKGSEFPRSYYKCSHPKCGAKKKVERSPDGQITEIVYKGSHNHPKPNGSCFRNFYQLGSSKDSETRSDWRANGLQETPSVHGLLASSAATKTNNEASKSASAFVFESTVTQELSSTLASIDVDDDIDEDEAIAIQGRRSQLGDNGGSSEPKRRRKDICLAETSLSTKSVRESRVVVQIESEIDVLDDGYRWRKYGQKVVKGNLNPRSYYKCTSAGCPVRKHVERVSDNMKSVLTTYEGKHNHEVPPNKAINDANPNPSVSGAGVTVGGMQLHLQNHHHSTSFQFHSEPIAACGDKLFRPELFNEVKFPPLHSSLPAYNYYSNLHHSQLLPEFPMPFLPLSFPSTYHVSNFPPLADFHHPLTVELGHQRQISENSSTVLIKPKEKSEENEHVIYGPTSPTAFCSRVIQHFPS